MTWKQHMHEISARIHHNALAAFVILKKSVHRNMSQNSNEMCCVLDLNMRLKLSVCHGHIW